MGPIEVSHHGKEKTRFIRKTACQVFDLQDSEGIIEFHSKDNVWFFPPDGVADPKKIKEFAGIADLERIGTVNSGTPRGLIFRILDAEKHGLVSKTRQA